MLPNRPPIGTQYSFLVKTGTTTVGVPAIATQADMFTSKGHAVGADDAFYELSGSTTSAPLAIAAGNAKIHLHYWKKLGNNRVINLESFISYH